MKKNELSELSTEELTKQKNSLQGILIGTLIVMLLLCSALIYLSIKKQSYALLAIFPALLAMLLPNGIKWSQLNAELKSRHSS